MALNLVACFTPVRSHESNGVSEAFVKTLKRDYARIHPRPDATAALQQLPAWIEDYNEVRSPKGLRIHLHKDDQPVPPGRRQWRIDDSRPSANGVGEQDEPPAGRGIRSTTRQTDGMAKHLKDSIKPSYWASEADVR